jgi:transposase
MGISRGQLLAIVRSTLDASPKLAFARSDGELTVTDEQRDELLRWARASATPQRIVVRCTIVLLAAAGWTDSRIAAEVRVTRRTVALWRGRYVATGGRALLVDAPGRGRKPGRDAATVQRILVMSAQAPADGERWTVRSLARAVGVSHATVQRVWKEHIREGAQP